MVDVLMVLGLGVSLGLVISGCLLMFAVCLRVACAGDSAG